MAKKVFVCPDEFGGRFAVQDRPCSPIRNTQLTEIYPKSGRSLLFIIPEFFYIDSYQEMLYYNDIPLGSLITSSYLRAHGNVKTDIIDLRLESEKYPDLAIRIPDKERIRRSLIRVLENNHIQEFQNVGLSCYTSFQYQYTDMIANIIREEFPLINIIVGGYHPTAVPQDFTYPNSPYNCIIRCEAELVLLELFKSNILAKPMKNLSPMIRSSHSLIDINTIPFPDYELYLSKYPFKNHFKFELYMSRGCPYQCAFCGKNWEFREYSYKNVLYQFNKLLDLIETYNPNNPRFIFADQSFNRVRISDKILDYILSNKLQERYVFVCQSRVETVGNNVEKIEKFKKCKLAVGYGFESANPTILKEMHKTNNPRNYIELMKRILSKYDVYSEAFCRLNILCGFPGEDHNSFIDTIDFYNTYARNEAVLPSPTLFSNYPNVFVYENMKYFEDKYGTEFLREWWKLPMNPLKGCVVQRPSYSYSLKSLIRDYVDFYLPILNGFGKQTFIQLATWKRFFEKWWAEL